MKHLCLLTLGLLAFATPVLAGPTPDADKKTAAATAKPSILEVAVPQSVFCMTNGPVKDPFFPNSTRLQVRIAKATPVISSAEIFKITGLSGLPGQRLVLINGYNFAKGEAATVNTPNGKVFIRVIDIKEYSAVIRIEGQDEPYEVFLNKNLR